MKRTRVENSSQIEEVGYDPTSHTLEVMFKGNKIYHYFDVPTVTYEGLLAAVSAGKYFNTNVRAIYQFERVS